MLKVFLVDDDITVLKGLKKVIPWEKLNAEVIGEGRNGQIALQRAAESRPDLIITDIKMPIMDGLELSRRVYEEMPDVSIILLSAYEDFAYAKTAIQYNVKEYILKPIDHQKIKQLVDRISDISKRMDKRNILYSDFTGNKIEDFLLEAVRSGNEEGIISFLEDKFFQYRDDINLVRELSFKLAGTVFQMAGKLGLELELYGINKDEMIGQIFSLKTTGEIKKFTLDIYIRLVRYINTIKESKSSSLVEEITYYINNNFTNPEITVASVADKFNISASYLSLLFRQTKGVTLNVYISQFRINRAKELLKKQNINISNVCKMAGYTDYHYFTKVFKKAEGMTPSTYRSMCFNPVQEFI